MKKFSYGLIAVLIILIGAGCNQPRSQNAETNTADTSGVVLPFPEPPSASTYGESILESKHVRRAYPRHLPADAPNIVIVLMDDVGFGLPSTFGGEINTPTLTRVWNAGIAYNEFHTTS